MFHEAVKDTRLSVLYCFKMPDAFLPYEGFSSISYATLLPMSSVEFAVSSPNESPVSVNPSLVRGAL